MPILLQKHRVPHRTLLRDVRPASQRIAEVIEKPYAVGSAAAFLGMVYIIGIPDFMVCGDILLIFAALYFWWASRRTFKLALKFPQYANLPDPNNPTPGKRGAGKSDGILYLGNADDPDETTYGQELWLTNSDARTHILYLGTTGSGKTEGLKALVTNALGWGSGYVYVDGKADTDLWASLYSVARRFGRDDDVFVLNYMTGNSDDGALSNSMNPFANGSSSYLANMLTDFMPEAGGDNAMWKERAVALMFALMPALVYKRDSKGLLLDIGVVRDHIELQPIIKLSREPDLPQRISHALHGYLHTLPGFVDDAFDDDGNEKPPSPDKPMYDLQVARQQHGYLSMQFTRSLQMLADEYRYIFKEQLADIDMLDVVVNRRILITLIPALEKSTDEAANLGKIVAATLKGMMGMTLGNTVEGSWESTVGSKQTRSASPFMTVFDEVGYYTAKGMAVMAAQARSLGFSLVFASQDLPSMEKRAKQEAQSILGNCNLKIYGRIEDPTDTMQFIEKHTQNDYVMETAGMKAPTSTVASLFLDTPFYDDRSAKIEKRIKFDGDHLKVQREGEFHWTFAELFGRGRMFYVNPGKVKALRVHRLLGVEPAHKALVKRDNDMKEVASRLKNPEWKASTAAAETKTSAEIAALAKGAAYAREPIETGIMAIANLVSVPVSKTPAIDTDTAAANTKAPGKTPAIAAKSTGGAPPKSATTSTPGSGMVSMPKDSKLDIPEISPAEKASLRASLPPLHEGDQFAIMDMETAPKASGAPTNGAPSTSKSPAAETAHPPASVGGGFASTDADLSVVTRIGGSDGDGSVLDVKLPPDIASILEKSAKKLNEGLAGTNGGKK